MEICEQYRIPHSFYLGGSWRWTEADRAKAMLYRKWKAEACPRCGTRPADWEKDPNFRVADTVRCEGCARLDELQDQVKNPPRGTSVGLFPPGVVIAKLDQEE